MGQRAGQNAVKGSSVRSDYCEGGFGLGLGLGLGSGLGLGLRLGIL